MFTTCKWKKDFCVCDFFKVTSLRCRKKKTCEFVVLYLMKILLKSDNEMPTKVKLREFIAILILQGMVIKVLQNKPEMCIYTKKRST